MKRLLDYILEETEEDLDLNENPEEDNQEESKSYPIVFKIWETPEKIVTKLKDNKSYQKIQYTLRNKEKGIYIDFLIGYDEDTWKLWIGKVGYNSYDDDPYCSLNTDDFKEALMKAVDKANEFIGKVEKEPDDYIRFYKTK